MTQALELISTSTGEHLCEAVKKNCAKDADAIIALAREDYAKMCAENAGQPTEVKRHTFLYIYPTIAVYKALLETSGDAKGAYDLVANAYAEHARRYRRILRGVLRVPLLYRAVPSVMRNVIHNTYGTQSGFEMKDYPKIKGECHIDMLRCPYNDNCVRYGCGELTRAFCDSDDVSYGDMHPRLYWERTKTLGRGDECCDFIIRIKP